jgi:tetratricopeptide (TPR) repeat protein
MQKQITPSLIILLVCTTFSAYLLANTSSTRPIRKSELLALVAGGVLPENLTVLINSRGLAFRPDSSFRSQLESAGANTTILHALDSAKKPDASPDDQSDKELSEQLTKAGSLINAQKYLEAASELTQALRMSFASAESGFVMGQVLAKQQRWQQAQAVYVEVLQKDPGFPEVHTKLSYILYRAGDPESALREANAALEETPNNAEAHKNKGLAFENLRNFDAAAAAYQTALQLKPDYENVLYDLGILKFDKGDMDGAIAEYKKALALKPDDVNARYNLGVTYGQKGDYVSAIREYREVKRLDPNRLDARQNLGAELEHVDPAAAITEFRELAALAPDFPICHQCLGSALYNSGKYQEAEKEYAIAAQLDPTDPAPHSSIGHIREVEKNYDQALVEYRKAQELDNTFAGAFTDAGRVLVLKKDFPGAIAELKHAEELDPASWTNHDLRGQAQEGSGDRDAAIAEYKEALSIAPKELQARLDLASALEKKGDWLAALDNYHRAALDEPPLKPGPAVNYYDAQRKYENAQKRFEQHLADLRSSGKASEAAALEAGLRSKASTANFDEKFHDAMQTSQQALMEKRFDDAETSAKQAIEIAEKIQPQDARLQEAVGRLGSIYGWRMDFKNAEETYKRQLTLCQKLYGPKSPMIVTPLQSLAMVAAAQNDFPKSEALFSQAIGLNEATYGQDSAAVADTLSGLASVYFKQQNFAKTESTLLRVIHIYEIAHNSDDLPMGIPLGTLCYVYDQWGKPDKSAPCHARLVALEEKQFGPDSPYLVRDLTAEAEALRKLGRTAEADQIENRLQSLPSAQANPN